MIVVGDLINGARKPIGDAILARDARTIRKAAADQVAAGAGYIGVNAGVLGAAEADCLAWLVTVIQAAADIPCCIDSYDPGAIEAALAVHKGSAPAMVNALSLEKERHDTLLPLLRGSGVRVVALCIGDEGMPETANERAVVADRLINSLAAADIPLSHIHVDPLVQPVAVNCEFGLEFINAMNIITTQYRGVHAICRLSGISTGLPSSRFLDRTFAAMAVAGGLDSVIANPLDRGMAACLAAAECLAGRDPECANFLAAARAGLFDMEN